MNIMRMIIVGAIAVVSLLVNSGIVSAQAQELPREYVRDMVIANTSKIYFHKPSKTLVYVEQSGEQASLMVVKNNGKTLKLETLCTRQMDGACGQFKDVNVSPRGIFLFVGIVGAIEGSTTKMFDLRTGKEVNMHDKDYNPIRDVYFSRDAKRMAIHTQESEQLSTSEGIYVQDPKTLKMKRIYAISFAEYVNGTHLVSLRNVAFNTRDDVTFEKVDQQESPVALPAVVTKYRYNYASGKLVVVSTGKVKSRP